MDGGYSEKVQGGVMGGEEDGECVLRFVSA